MATPPGPRGSAPALSAKSRHAVARYRRGGTLRLEEERIAQRRGYSAVPAQQRGVTQAHRRRRPECDLPSVADVGDSGQIVCPHCPCRPYARLQAMVCLSLGTSGTQGTQAPPLVLDIRPPLFPLNPDPDSDSDFPLFQPTTQNYSPLSYLLSPFWPLTLRGESGK